MSDDRRDPKRLHVRRTNPGKTVPAAPSPFYRQQRPTTPPSARPPVGPKAPPSSPDIPIVTGERWLADRRRRQEIGQVARAFLVQLDALARLLVVHDASNDAVRAAIEAIEKDLGRLQAQEGDVAIVFAEGHAFVNGVWVRATKRAYEAGQLLCEELGDLDGRGFVLQQGASLQGIVQLARLLRRARRGMSDEERRDSARDLKGVRLVPVTTADEARMGRTERALSLLKDGLQTLSRMELANLDLHLRRRQRALVRSIVQLSEEDPEELLGITGIRDPTLPSVAHNLMVTIYAVALGRSMDLGRRDLMRLGVAALNHNIGESALPGAPFGEPRRLQRDEREIIERHPLEGLRHLLVHYGYGAPTVERAIVSAEHHVHWDGSGGYPFRSWEARHGFSRIVAVCDVFDALCGRRPFRPAYAPDQAVKLLLRQAGRELDPVLVRAMVRLVGRYPPGALVELDNGELAVVLGPGQGATPLLRPRVLLIADQDGFEHEVPMAVDLGERYPRRRAWLRTIARPRDAARMGLRVARYLLADRLEVPPVVLDGTPDDV